MPTALAGQEPGTLYRSALVRAASTEDGKRGFDAVGVPYESKVTVRDWWGEHTEEFARDSVEEIEGGAFVFWNHRDVIGRVKSATSSDTGYDIKGAISDTTIGRDAHAMLLDGTIDRCSIGFQPIEWREDEEGHITYTKVRAVEFSLVPLPAYDDAKVTGVRHQSAPPQKGSTVETETLTRAELTQATEPLNTALTDLTRSVELLREGQSGMGSTAPNFRDMGEFLQAIYRGDETAAEFHRAYTGGSTEDAALTDTFVGDFIKLVQDRRRIINKFSTGSLPAVGMSVDYVKLLEDGTVVAEQVNEGDDLEYGNVKLARDTAPVKTYGGWTDLSRQVIERSSTPVLTTTLEAMGIKYGRVTNNAVATVYADTITDRLAAFNDVGTPDTTAAVSLPATQTTDEWLDMIVDAAIHYENTGFQLAGLDVSKDVFKKLLRLKDGDRRIMNVFGSGGQATVGELNLSAVSGNLANVRVELLPNVTGNVASFYDPYAIKTLESPGAPARLQDENIINLTKQFSIYGDMAVLVPAPAAILPVNFEV